MTRCKWEMARRILCLRLDALGDVLMTTPALRALAESHPGRSLTLLTSPAGAEVAPLVPAISNAIVYDAPWLKATAPRADSSPEFAMIDRLRAQKFDAAVIFTVYSQSPLPSAMLCFLADIPLRLAHCRENPYQLLTDWLPEPEPDGLIRHEVQRQLDLVAAVGCHAADDRLALCLPDDARLRALALLDECGIRRGDRWVVIHPGASAPSRRYPAEGYAEAARALVRGHGWEVVFTGTESERELVEGIRESMAAPSHSLAGRLSLAEFAALLEGAPLVITNNSGPAHVAAAVGAPVVDLYALTNPQHTPWRVPRRVLFHDVPCKYCYKSVCPQKHHDCLRLVPPADVVRAALELIAEASEPAATGQGSHAYAGH